MIRPTVAIFLSIMLYGLAADSSQAQTTKIGQADNGTISVKYTNYDEAVTELSKRIEANPREPALFLLRAVAKRHLKEFDQAIDDLNAALALDFSNSDVFEERGLNELWLWENTNAITDFDKAIQLDVENHSPDLYEAYDYRALAKRRLGDTDGSSADFSKAILSKPSNWFSYDQKGLNEYVQGSFTDAINDFNMAIDINGHDSFGYVNRAVAEECIKDYRDALADVDKAIKLSPHYPQAYDYRGYLEYDLGQWDAALSSFRKALQLDPSDDDARLRIWVISARSGQRKKADEELSDSLQNAPSNTLSFSIGRFLTGEITENELLERYKTLGSAEPAESDALLDPYFYIGVRYIIDNDTNKARYYLNETLHRKGNSPTSEGAQAELNRLDGKWKK